MTLREKKEYLESYLYYERSIKQKLDEIERMETLATRATSTYSFTPKGQGSMEDIYIKLAELHEWQINKLYDEIKALADKKERISRAIDKAEDAAARDALKYRYINGLTAEETAEKMGCSARNVYFLIRRGMAQIL